MRPRWPVPKRTLKGQPIRCLENDRLGEGAVFLDHRDHPDHACGQGGQHGQDDRQPRLQSQVGQGSSTVTPTMWPRSENPWSPCQKEYEQARLACSFWPQHRLPPSSQTVPKLLNGFSMVWIRSGRPSNPRLKASFQRRSARSGSSGGSSLAVGRLNDGMVSATMAEKRCSRSR